MRYAIWVQPDNNDQYTVLSPSIVTAKKFAAWLHKATSAAVQIYDEQSMNVRETYGDFDASRT